MSNADRQIMIVAIFILTLFSFMLGVLVTKQPQPCKELQTHNELFINEKGQIFRVNLRVTDTTRLLRLPGNVDAIKVLH
jgi:hypothetical protein